jgi:protein involved in polysaccharide export with SLBB domain
VTDIIQSLWSDLLLSADLDYAIIVREVTPNGNVKVLQFNLANALADPDGEDNIQLKPRDTLLVFHHANQHYQREKLNTHIREKIIDSLELPKEQRWLLGDIAGDTFASFNNSEVELNTAATALQQRQMLQREVFSILNDMFTNPEALQLSKHFNRTELLYPVLKKLRQQSNSSDYLQIVSIDGDVKVPGDYPLTQKAHLSALLDAAGGFNDSAYTIRAELSRRSELSKSQNGVEVLHQSIDLASILAGQEDITLQSRDRVNIFETPDWRKERAITLTGEVRFPGKYSIMQGERLSDVIQRAGGLTENAFAFGAIFTREQIKQKESIQVAKLIEQLKSDIATRSLSTERLQSSPQDTMFMLNELEKVKPVGRLVINLEQIAAQNPLYDIAVDDGDSLMVPRQNRAITVVGEVQYAGSHRFDDSFTTDDYLSLAGGTRKRADEQRTYIIRADGSVAMPNTDFFSFSRDKVALQPGDTIVVPVDTEYKDNITLWAQVTQIIYQSAIALSALSII